MFKSDFKHEKHNNKQRAKKKMMKKPKFIRKRYVYSIQKIVITC